MRHVRCSAVAALLLMAAGGVATAQEREVGLKLGASVATLDRESTQSGDDPYGTRTGMTAGAFGLLPLHHRLGLQLELLITEKGASLPLQEPGIAPGSLTTRFRFRYLDLPVLARVRGPRIKSAPIYAFAGPTFSIRISGKQQTVFDAGFQTGFERDLGEEMKRFDLGLTFGAGVQLRRRLSIDAGYTQGFSDVLAEERGTALSNRGLLVTAGVRLF